MMQFSHSHVLSITKRFFLKSIVKTEMVWVGDSNSKLSDQRINYRSTLAVLKAVSFHVLDGISMCWVESQVLAIDFKFSNGS